MIRRLTSSVSRKYNGLPVLKWSIDAVGQANGKRVSDVLLVRAYKHEAKLAAPVLYISINVD